MLEHTICSAWRQRENLRPRRVFYYMYFTVKRPAVVLGPCQLCFHRVGMLNGFPPRCLGISVSGHGRHYSVADAVSFPLVVVLLPSVPLLRTSPRVFRVGLASQKTRKHANVQPCKIANDSCKHNVISSNLADGKDA